MGRPAGRRSGRRSRAGPPDRGYVLDLADRFLDLYPGDTPLSAAFVSFGAASAIAELVLHLTGSGSAHLSLLVICTLALVLGQFISHVATVLVMAPVAVTFAQTLDITRLDPSFTLSRNGA